MSLWWSRGRHASKSQPGLHRFGQAFSFWGAAATPYHRIPHLQSNNQKRRRRAEGQLSDFGSGRQIRDNLMRRKELLAAKPLLVLVSGVGAKNGRDVVIMKAQLLLFGGYIDLLAVPTGIFWNWLSMVDVCFCAVRISAFFVMKLRKMDLTPCLESASSNSFIGDVLKEKQQELVLGGSSNLSLLSEHWSSNQQRVREQNQSTLMSSQCLVTRN